MFLAEVASREFMDNLVSILKMPGLNLDVKNKILRLVQIWAIAFEGRSNLSYVGEVYKTLQREGAWSWSPILLCYSRPQRLQLPATRLRRRNLGHG